jgi:hypothetical protein
VTVTQAGTVTAAGQGSETQAQAVHQQPASGSAVSDSDSRAPLS